MPSACRRAGRGRTASSRGQPYHLATACRDHAIPFDAGAANTGGSAPIRLEHTMDSLFNRNTNDVASNESGATGATPQHVANDAPATVVNPLYAGERAGESAAPASSPAATSDACAYVAEPAPQQTVPAKECDGKQPGRAANLLLVATLAAVCGLAGGLAGSAIMSAATGGSTQAVQGGMGGGQGGMQGSGTQDGGAPSAGGTTDNSEGAANGSARVVRRPRARPMPTARATLRRTARPTAQTALRAMCLRARAIALLPRRLPFPPSHPHVRTERHDHDQAWHH